MVGFAVLAAWGLRLVPTGRSVVLAYTTPLWVIPGAVLFLRERLTARRMAGVAIGLLGLLVLFNPLAFDWADRQAILGNGAIILAAMLWAASILHIRGHRWHSTPFDLVPWEMLLATAILTPLAVVASGVPAAEWNGRLGALLLYAGVPGTAVAYWATAVASRNLPAVTTALGLLTTPVVSVAVATAVARGAADRAAHRGDRAHPGRDRHRNHRRPPPGGAGAAAIVPVARLTPD